MAIDQYEARLRDLGKLSHITIELNTCAGSHDWLRPGFTAGTVLRRLCDPINRHPLLLVRMMHLARRPPQWLRVALAGLLLAFAVNSIAHVTHRHDAAPSSATHSFACGYCLSFNGLADAPRHDHAPLAVAHESFYLVADIEPWFAPRQSTSARPRAPPAL